MGSPYKENYSSWASLFGAPFVESTYIFSFTLCDLNVLALDDTTPKNYAMDLTVSQ